MSRERALPLRVLALACFAAAGVLMAGLGAVWAREAAYPRVVLLGSGGRVSALVAAGDARALIATGSDPAAFAAALEQARQPVQRRIDLLLVAGRGDDLLVPAAVAADPGVRMSASLGPITSPPDAPALASLPAVTEPRLVTLPDGITVLLETAPDPSARDGGGTTEPRAWQATVTRGATRVVVLSDGDAAGLFPPTAAPALVVVAGSDPLATMAPGSGRAVPALAFADGELSPREMRAPGALHVAWAVRVFDGEAIVLAFVDGGLAIPPDAAVALADGAGATPAP